MQQTIWLAWPAMVQHGMKFGATPPGLAKPAPAKTALRPATVIDAIGVPKELEERGYTSAVVAQRLIDEIIRIGDAAASLQDRAAFSSLPF